MVSVVLRAQEVLERPIRNRFALPSSIDVCEPEMDAKQDPRFDDIVGEIGDARVVSRTSRVVWIPQLRSVAGHREVQFVLPKKSRRVRVKAPVRLFAPDV